MKMKRRDFIKSTAIASMGMLLSSCSNYIRLPINKWRDNNSNATLWQKIFFYASLAPSGHNTQPWIVELNNKDEFIIKIREESLLPAVDPVRRETYLSIGAFLENLIISARSFGVDLEYEVISKSTLETDVIFGKFSKSSIKENNLYSIAKRRTIKSNYLNKEVSKADIDSCFFKNIKASYYPTGSTNANILNEATYLANETQVNRKATQIELSKWIRWSNKEAKKKRDGITPASMEINGLSGFFVRTFYNEKNVISKSFKKQTLKKVKEQLKQHGGWVVISSLNSNPKELIETGRTFEQFLLKASTKNIAIHPMTQVLEELPFKNEIASDLGISQIPQFFLRIGYLNRIYPTPVSLRRPVDSFLKTENFIQSKSTP